LNDPFEWLVHNQCVIGSSAGRVFLEANRSRGIGLRVAINEQRGLFGGSEASR
jgi:hypothetical protein